MQIALRVDDIPKFNLGVSSCRLFIDEAAKYNENTPRAASKEFREEKRADERSRCTTVK